MMAISEVTLFSFFIAAGISIVVLLYRAIKKVEDEYIPFGPFLVMAAFFVMFAGDGVVLRGFVGFCKMISSKLVGGF